jgi:hypothetical protein
VGGDAQVRLGARLSLGRETVSPMSPDLASKALPKYCEMAAFNDEAFCLVPKGHDEDTFGLTECKTTPSCGNSTVEHSALDRSARVRVANLRRVQILLGHRDLSALNFLAISPPEKN